MWLWVSLPLNRVANGSVQGYRKAYHISCQIRQTSYPRRLAELAGPAVGAFSNCAVSSSNWRGSGRVVHQFKIAVHELDLGRAGDHTAAAGGRLQLGSRASV